MRKHTVFNNLPLVLSFCILSATTGIAQDTLKIDPSSPGNKISNSFTGMAYESDALRFDSLRPSNHTLVQYFKTAGIKTFRLGGNSVQNYTYYATSVNKNPMDTLNNAELDSLFRFAEAVGCKIILGMNFSYYKELPYIDAQEVNYVMSNYSDDMLAFEIGNEPNLYSQNGDRSRHYTYDSFQIQFTNYLDTILKYNPTAPISGPSAARQDASSYTNPFAHNMKGKISLLTQHYYAIPENVGTIPNRIDSLLNFQTDDSIKHLCDTLVGRADTGAGVPFQMDECNALYPFSRWGLNNCFASSLWALDYMYSLAEAGVLGINVHTIYNAAASVIQDAGGHYTAEPLYYGMLAFQLNNNGRFLPYTFKGTAKNLAVHPVLDTIGNIAVTLINKDTANPVTFQVYADSLIYTSGQMISMTANTVSDTFGVTLGGSQVTPAGMWSGTWTTITASHGCFPITIPKATAIVLELKNSTGINELMAKIEEVRIYPNPNKGRFTIQLSVGSSQTILEIYNTLGERVCSQFNIQNPTFNINLSKPSGVYLYRVLDENGNVISNGKFVIER
jgi:hypothetical protein